MPTAVDKQVKAKSRIVKRNVNSLKAKVSKKTLKSGYCKTDFSVFIAQKRKKTTQKKEKQQKYLQRLIFCRKTTYDSDSKGHSLWVNYKAVHCCDFHKAETSKPIVRVKNGWIVLQ